MSDQEKANEFRSQEKVVRCVIQWLDKCLPDCDLLEQIRDLADELHDKAADFEKPSPQLIQGYTAENWQEIIDGGYLCEFANRPELPWWPGRLKETPREKGSTCMASCDEKIQHYTHCRPAQIKGVMRPIFVEPVDDPYCVFFDVDGKAMHHGMMRWSLHCEYNFKAFNCDRLPTKYIEL